MQSTEYHIRVQALRSNAVDEGAAGTYRVLVPIQAQCKEVADIVIESFHRAVPLSFPEDFEITIIDIATGIEMLPAYRDVESVFECKRLGGI